MSQTCPGEGGDGTKGEGSAEAPRQRGRGRLALTGTPLAVDELGQVGGRGGDEGVCQVRRERRRLAAEGGDWRATCKESATEEQRSSLLHEITISVVSNTLYDTFERFMVGSSIALKK